MGAPFRETKKESGARLFWRRASAFLFLQLLIASALYGFSLYRESRFHFTNSNTHSVLRPIYRDGIYGVVILGTSRARNFAKSNQHSVEGALGRKVMNLSRNGAGIVPESVALRTFFGRGNRAESVIYFLDPWAFYIRDWNEALPFGNEEPWALDFLFQMVAHGVPLPLVAEYYYSKFSPAWWAAAAPADIEPAPLGQPHLDAESVANRIALLYHRRGIRTRDLDQRLFARYSSLLGDLVGAAEAKGVKRILLVLPPTLLGYEPGREVLLHFLREHWPEGEASVVTVLDHSNILRDPALFESLDHLNPRGIEIYSAKHLRPWLP